MHYKGNDNYDDNYTEILGCYKNYDDVKEELEKLEYDEFRCVNKYFYIEEKYLIE